MAESALNAYATAAMTACAIGGVVQLVADILPVVVAG